MAADSYSWDRKMRDLMSETDANISTLKKNITPKFSTPQNVYGLGRSEINEFSSAKFLEHSPTWKTPPRDVFASEQILGGYTMTQHLSQSQHGAIKSLSKQINHLEQNFATMSKTAAKLQYENKVQSQEIKQLKGELKHVSRRLHEKGVDVSTEHKLQQWQQEMRSELDAINRLMKTKSTTAGQVELFDTSLVALSRDIAENKRLAQDEADANRREIDHLRSRILKLENDVAASIGEIKEIARHQTHFQQEIGRENARRKTHPERQTEIENERRKAEISELRLKIDDFIEEFSRKISSSQINNVSPQKPSKEYKNEVKSTRKHVHRKLPSLEDLEKEKESFENDDYDILSTELDDSSLNLSDEDFSGSFADDNDFLKQIEDDDMLWPGRKPLSTSLQYDDIF